jgi:hypothetical protein
MTFGELQTGDRFMFSAFRKATLRKVGPDRYADDKAPDGDSWPSEPDTPVVLVGRIQGSGLEAASRPDAPSVPPRP